MKYEVAIIQPTTLSPWATLTRPSLLVRHTPFLQHNLTLKIAQLNITTCFDVVPRRLFPSTLLAYLYFIATFSLITLCLFAQMTVFPS